MNEQLDIAPPAERYSLTAVVLHWVLGLVLVGLFAMGLYMAELPISPWRLKLFNWHKWAGICVLMLSVGRLVWRITHRPPPLPVDIQNDMPAWQHHAHYLTQYAMYALFFVVPLVGWAYSSAAGFPVVLFGVLPLPDVLSRDKALGHQLEDLHSALAVGLMVLVGAHIAAALYHYRVLQDDILQRMLPTKTAH